MESVLLVLLLLLASTPLCAQTTASIVPDVDDTYAVGAYNLRFKYVWTEHLSVGNPGDSHNNVLLKVGSGQLARTDLTVGIGSGLTSAYATNSAPVFTWVGGDNGDVFGHDETIVLTADGTPRASSNVWLHTITLPAAASVDPTLAVPNIRGLTLKGYSTSVGAGYSYYPQPTNVAASSVFWIKSGLSVIDDIVLMRHTELQLTNGSAVRANGALGITVSGSVCTITAIAGGIITGASCTP